MLASIIGMQGVALFLGGLVAHIVDRTAGVDSGGLWVWIGSILAVLCIADAGLMRRPWGITLGWLLQAATLALCFKVPMMFWVWLCFFALWLTSLAQGRKIDDLAERAQAAYAEAEQRGENAEQRGQDQAHD